ncbi:trypsin-like peptidase domain-containing protein [Planktomarina temperata]|nr:trypsin-like peptidase domain-containing protein [Planktomarina temperata]
MKFLTRSVLSLFAALLTPSFAVAGYSDKPWTPMAHCKHTNESRNCQYVDINIRWHGPLKNKKPSGTGVWEVGNGTYKGRIKRHRGHYRLDGEGSFGRYCGDITKVGNNYPNLNKTYMVYKGQWKNGKRHGLGIGVYSIKNHPAVVDGYWKDGQLIGRGNIVEGLWQDNKFIRKQATPYKLERARNCPNASFINASGYFANAQPSPLKQHFVRLSEINRMRIQSNLQTLGLYKSSIDGLYGKGTAGALTAYNKAYLGKADLKKQENVINLISTVLARKPSVDTAKPKVAKPVPKPQSPAPKPQSKEIYNVASGTGFYVSDAGHIITNHHVIDGCKDIKVHSKGEVLTTLKIADDRQNDLALLKVSHKPSHVFPLSGDSPYPLQDIVVAGFPFGDRVSSSLKFTKGIVSSLSGIGNNYSEIQIDAALQPGNSGGPIIDEYGNIIAVAVAKLDMKKILKDYGVIPENTNFGIKTSAVRNLLQGNAVSTKPPNTEILSKQALSRTATDGTVFLSCWMTVAQIEDMKSRKVLFTDLE